MQAARGVEMPPTHHSFPRDSLATDQDGEAAANAIRDLKVIRRNGAVVGFEAGKISVAMTKAFLAVDGSQAAASARVRERVGQLTGQVVGALMRRLPMGGTAHIEDIQDQVELALMRSGEHDVARLCPVSRKAGRGAPAAARDLFPDNQCS